AAENRSLGPPAPMLTRRGWLTLAAGAALIGAGRLFGLYELYILGAGAAGLAVAALVQVALARPRLVAVREVRPARVHAGSEARVELFVRNRAGRRSPVLSLQDPFTRAGSRRDDPAGGRGGGRRLPRAPPLRGRRRPPARPLEGDGSLRRPDDPSRRAAVAGTGHGPARRAAPAPHTRVVRGGRVGRCQRHHRVLAATIA